MKSNVKIVIFKNTVTFYITFTRKQNWLRNLFFNSIYTTLPRMESSLHCITRKVYTLRGSVCMCSCEPWVQIWGSAKWRMTALQSCNLTVTINMAIRGTTYQNAWPQHLIQTQGKTGCRVLVDLESVSGKKMIALSGINVMALKLTQLSGTMRVGQLFGTLVKEMQKGWREDIMMSGVNKKDYSGSSGI